MKLFVLAVPLAAAIVLGASSISASASPAAGTWRMQNGKVTVAVSDCGGDKLCGRIVALKEPLSKIDGKPKVDRKNPNPALRTKPIIGLSILKDMKKVASDAWQGAIYNADDGRTYQATLRLAGDSMNVQACVMGVMCKTISFVRRD